jgi:uncharacterized protein YlaI
METTYSDCAVCSALPEDQRQSMRETLISIPLRKWVCDDCVMAWWGNTVRNFKAAG